MAKSQLDSDATSAMVYGINSLPITLSRLNELPNRTFTSELTFSDRGKEVGQFSIKISPTEYRKKEDSSKPPVKYNPFISRVLYQEECTDILQLQSSIKTLEEQLELMYKEIEAQKKEEQYFEKVYFDLEED